MKKLILVLTMSLGAQVCFGSIYGLKSEEIAQKVRQVISDKMIQKQLIKTQLEHRDLWSLIASTDILKSPKLLNISAEVGPEESNCNCQDVFRVQLTATVNNGLINILGTPKIEKLYSGQ